MWPLMDSRLSSWKSEGCQDKCGNIWVKCIAWVPQPEAISKTLGFELIDLVTFSFRNFCKVSPIGTLFRLAAGDSLITIFVELWTFVRILLKIFSSRHGILCTWNNVQSNWICLKNNCKVKHVDDLLYLTYFQVGGKSF